MLQTVQIIRDVIRIDNNLPFITGLQPGDTLRLIAGQITLTQTYDLKGRNLELYASTFIALNGAAILNQGTIGVQGREGDSGFLELRPPGTRDGSDGKIGHEGGSGTDGGVLKVIAEVMTGLNVSVKGGDGGKGGTGGLGGNGDSQDVRMDVGNSFQVFLGNAGNGGPGGPGGNGGKGGTVTISSVNYTTDPIIDDSGGKSGDGGDGNEPGNAGKIHWIRTRPEVLVRPETETFGGRRGHSGKLGELGADGPAGVVDKKTLSYDEFWSSLASESFAADWAKHRHAVGEFFFRSYVPGAADRDQYIGMAVDEFNAALRLDPKQTDSALRLEQIWNNINPLGLPRNFDVIPDFKEYIANLTGLANLVATFTSIGNTLLLNSSDLQAFQDIFKSQKAQSDIRINEATADLDISKQNERDIDAALKEVGKMIDDVKQQIEKGKEEMKRKPLSFGDIVGNIGELAAAVSAVMAAVPTGGASLLVLAPDIISFSKTVYDNSAPLVQAIIDDKQTQTLTVAQGQYAKVKKDVDDIDNASKKVTNLLNVINTIKRVKTPDNSKLMDLVQKGAELAYEHLLKQQELKRAQMKTKALREKLVSEGELREFHDAATARAEISEVIIREAGLKVIQAASTKVDVILEFAFRAQRSIEIYLLEDQTQSVYYDAGRVHPDLEAEYIRTGDPNGSLTTSYQLSFARLLDPTDMWKSYQRYFRTPHLKDIRRFSFTDPEILETFRSTFTLTFSFDVATLSTQRYGTKFQAVSIAFIGAEGKGDLVSCKLEHGALYSERTSNGTIQETILKARHDIVLAQTRPLQTSGFDLDSSPPIDDPQSSPLWAMGIGGLYVITIPKNEFEEHQPRFEGLKEIQVWFGYQFME